MEETTQQREHWGRIIGGPLGGCEHGDLLGMWFGGVCCGVSTMRDRDWFLGRWQKLFHLFLEGQDLESRAGNASSHLQFNSDPPALIGCLLCASPHPLPHLSLTSLLVVGIWGFLFYNEETEGQWGNWSGTKCPL